MKLTAPPSGAPSPPPSESGVPSSPPSGAPSPHLVQNFRGPQTLSDANSGAGKPFGASYHGENPTFYSSDAELKEFIAFVGECAVSLMNKFFPRKHSFPYRLVRFPNFLLLDANNDGLSSKTEARTGLERKYRPNTTPHQYGDSNCQ